MDHGTRGRRDAAPGSTAARRAARPAATPAERARSILHRCHEVTLARSGRPAARVSFVEVDPDARTVVVGVVEDPDTQHLADGNHTTTDGIQTTTDAPPGPRREPATCAAHLTATDVVLGAGPAAGRVRGIVDVSGAWVRPARPVQQALATAIAEDRPDPALLAVGSGTELLVLRPTAITLLADSGVSSVDLDDLLTSGPDPFAEIEGLWLEHLSDPRCPVVPALVRRLGCRAPGPDCHLSALDRFGLVLSGGESGSPRDVRLSFAEPCLTVADLGRQIRLLMGCPRSVRRIG